jgi:hypothetical protein
MQDILTTAVEFLRERLHTAFIRGCHLTAPRPIIIQPAPDKFPWKTTKAALLQGRDLTHNQDDSSNPGKLKTMEIILDNTCDNLKSDLLDGSNKGNEAELSKVIFPIIRRIVPNLIAFEIVGVQPMTGPVTHIHTLRVRYSQPEKENKEAIEGGPHLSIQVLKEVVEARNRKLYARWSLETASNSGNGEKIEREILAALAQEATAEMDQELLTKLHDLAGDPSMTFGRSQPTTGQTPTFIGESMNTLAVMIARQSNLIGARTRRGAGNWCVVSPTAFNILMSDTTSAFSRRDVAEGYKGVNTKFIGMLNNTIRVYVDQYARDDHPVLIGYKGNDIDSGVYFCPFLPLLSSGVVIDPQTFEPVVSFLTRYGYHVLEDNSTSLGKGADYFGKVGIDTHALSFL